EEAAVLGTPTLVLRNQTEWSYLLDAGCAALLGNREPPLAERALQLLTDAENQRMRAAARDLATRRPPADAAARIVAAIKQHFPPRRATKAGRAPGPAQKPPAGGGGSGRGGGPGVLRH